MSASTPFVRRFLLVIFTASGFVGLIYESIWSHYLQLFLGHAAYAQTLVLAIFMGGLAIGSALIAVFSHRIRNLLLGYVIAEFLIGLYALGFDGIYLGITHLAFDVLLPGWTSPTAIQLTKWTLGALAILPPAILLGMTFPLISAGIIRRFPERPGETIALLYFTNSIGASVGVLISGFYLIAAFGLPGTVGIAGAINIVLAAAVWMGVRGAPPVAEQVSSSDTPPATAKRLSRFVFAAAFATGAAAFLYEIGWIRALSLVLGSSTHSFELMLSAFILGIALGGYWIRKRIERADLFRLLGIVFIATGIFAALSIAAYNSSFDAMAFVMATFARSDAGYAGFNVSSHVIAMCIMVPATFFSGATLPLLTQLARQSHGESAIGKVYALNTVGSILGVFVAVHVLLPTVGLKGTIAIGALTHVSLGLSALLNSPESRRKTALLIGGAGLAIVLSIGLGVQLDPRRMTSSVFRSGVASQPQDVKVRYLEDGKTATISLVEHPNGLAIATNGKPDAMINLGPGRASPDEITMIMLAALPLAIHAQPAHVANIGIGSGLTSHVLLASDRVKQLDSIEIEPRMVEAAKLGFSSRNHALFDDPRSRIVLEDAKTFFAATNAKYDVIVSEPSNPWVSGVATLFSTEFYQRLTDYLTDDGLLIQWIQVYESDTSVIASIAGALAESFEDYRMYSTTDSDMVIAARKRGRLTGISEKIFAEPRLKAELKRVGIETVQDFQKRHIGSKRTLAPVFNSYGVRPNSDFFPVLDDIAPRLRFENRNALELTSIRLAPVPVMEILEPGPEWSEPTAIPESSFSLFDELSGNALKTIQAVQRGNVSGVSANTAYNVLMLDMSRDRCNAARAGAAWRSAVIELAQTTTGYLTAKETQPLWDRVLNAPCFGSLTPIEQASIHFQHAVALRDREAALKFGVQLLSSDWHADSQDETAFVVCATSAALIASGDLQSAKSILGRYGSQLKGNRGYAFMVRMLFALVTLNPEAAR